MISRRLRSRVRSDFPDPAAETVMERLDELNLGLAENQSRERIQAAVLLLAGGDTTRLELSARLAEQDWRDVLVPSGLADDDWPTLLDAELGPS